MKLSCYFTSIILASLFCNSFCEKKEYTLISLNGQVRFVYLEHSGYWLKEVLYTSENLREYPLIYTCEGIKSISRECSLHDDTITNLIRICDSIPLSESHLFFSPHFRTQGRNEPENLVHHGGEIFSLNDSMIVISFSLKGKGILFNMACNTYLNCKNEIDCPVPPKKLSLPFIILTSIEETRPLNEDEIKNSGLTPVNFRKFYLNVCE